MKTLIQTLVMIGLMVAAGFYAGRVEDATTELAAIKSGVFTITFAIYLAAVVILIRLDDKKDDKKNI